ncbi:hypothetical protein E4U17_004227 [Claviceps sp. LM77 group G4]|nr:hypothetical protein E4U17_004227 [Claviceps sp. LM77 group G4]
MEVYDMMRRQYWPSSANCDDSSDSDEYDSEAIDHDNDVIDHDEVVELLASSEVELSPGEIGIFSSLSSEIG